MTTSPSFRALALCIFFTLMSTGVARSQACTDGAGDYDVEQTEVNGFANLKSDQGTGQSFTAPCTGRIRSFSVGVTDVIEGPIEGTLRLLSGDGGGQTISTAAYSFTDAGMNEVVLNTHAPIQAGTVYTIFLDAPTSGTGNIDGINGDPFAGGRMWFGPDADNLAPLASDAVFAIDFAPGTCADGDNVASTRSNAFANLNDQAGVGQSFTAPCDGSLAGYGFEVGQVNDGPVQGTVRVFEGAGGGGRELARSTYSIDAVGAVDIVFPHRVSLTAGDVYTIIVDAPTSGTATVLGFNGNPMQAGNAWVGPTPDMLTAFSVDNVFRADFGYGSAVSTTYESLAALYFALDGDAWTERDNWLIGPLETWHGLTFNGPALVGLDLLTNNVAGAIPAEIGDLTDLEFVELSGNLLTGPLPPEVGELANATFFSVYGNQIDGQIPPEISGMSSIVHLQLGANQFSGPIPSSMGEMNSLVLLYLAGNQLNGPIPASFGQLVNLIHLETYDNPDMSGTLPIELTQISSLERLWVQNTGLCTNVDPAFTEWLAGVSELQESGCTNVAVEDDLLTPAELSIDGSYPNPFSGLTRIDFRIPEESDVRMDVFDTLGRRIRSLVSDSYAAGTHQASWDGTDDGGRPAPSGIYLVRVRAAGQSVARRMTLIR